MSRLNINRIITAVMLILSTSFGNNAGLIITVAEQQAGKLRLNITFDEPRLISENNQNYAWYTEASPAIDDNGYLTPVVIRFFNLGSTENLRLDVVKATRKSMKVDKYYRPENAGKSDGAARAEFTTTFAGLYRNIPLHVLKICPVKYDEQSKTMQWIDQAEIVIADPTQTTAKSTAAITNKARGNAFTASLLINNSDELQTAGSIAGVAKQLENTNSLLDTYQYIYKLALKQTGIYKITDADLAEAGYPLSSVQPQHLRLFNRGREIPIYFNGEEDGVFDPGDYFEFYGERNEQTMIEKHPDLYTDPFSDENVYWLVYGNTNGLRLIEENGGIRNTTSSFIFEPYAFRETLHIERDSHFENFGHWTSNLNRPSHEIDHWYFDDGVSAPEGGAYDFYLPHPFEQGNNVVIRAAFRGKSFYSYPENLLKGHRVELKLRGKDNVAKRFAVVLEDDRWTDQNLRFISNADSLSKLPQSLLNNGTNRLEVDMFQTGVSDIVLLNWFDISYLRKYRAYQNYLRFRVDRDNFGSIYVKLGDLIQIKTDGFSSPDVSLYKLGVSKIVNSKIDLIRENNTSFYRATIQDEVFDPDVDYVAVTESAKLKPAEITEYQAWKKDEPLRSLLDKSNSADYLIITTELLAETCESLKLLKEEAGLKPEIVTVDQIYEVFNAGVRSPLAIKDFIAYALGSWDSGNPLKYVVLVGDASYDYKGVYKSTSEIAPTFLYQTEKFGAAASDYWYALVSGDDYIPDVVVSRIPAATTEQLQAYIAKVEKYMKNPAVGAWRNSALFLSGNDASSREFSSKLPVFRAQSQRLIDMRLPAEVFAYRLNTVKDETIKGFDPNFGSTTDLIEYFDNGVSFINFLGHGGGGIWSDVALLALDDIDRLSNSEYLPFISSLTCFTGAFENPGRSCLGEKLVVAEAKGAIGFLGSSGVGWMYNDFAIEWGLFDYLWDKTITLGEAVDRMKIYYLNNPLYYTEDTYGGTPSYSDLRRSMVSQYNYLGDPAIYLHQPEKTIGVSVNKSLYSAGDTVVFQFNNEFSPLSGKIQIFGSAKDSLFLERSLQSGDFISGYSWVIPGKADEQYLQVKVYANGSSQDAAGSIRLAVQKTIISKIIPDPENPDVNQAISFTVTVHSPTPIIAMKLYNFRDYNASFSHGFTVNMTKINDSTFISQQPLSGFSNSGLKLFDVYTMDDLLNVMNSRWHQITVHDSRPDLSINSGSIRFAGSEKVQLQFTVSNISEIPASNVNISCYADDGIGSNQPFAAMQESFSSDEQKTIRVDFNSLTFQSRHRIIIKVDPDNSIAEQNELDNGADVQLTTDHVYVDAALGSSSDGALNGAIDLTERWKLYIPQNTLSKSGVIYFEEKPTGAYFNKEDDPSIHYMKSIGSDDTLGIYLKSNAIPDSIGFSAFLTIGLDTTLYPVADISRSSIFIYDEVMSAWRKVGGSLNGHRLTGHITRSGLYTALRMQDDKIPTIEITANGRPILDDTYLVSRPSIALILQDETGIDLTQSLNLKLDNQFIIQNGQILDRDNISFADSAQNAKTTNVLYTPKLSAGTHQLNVEVADMNGNKAQHQAQFQVTQGFDIKIFGNYPNPFKDQTIISFLIDNDDTIDELSIKIYTNSGRLVREQMLLLDESVANDDLRTNSYHELIWDGTDDDGVEVANGLYFLVMSGKYRSKTVKHTMKIAKLR